MKIHSQKKENLPDKMILKLEGILRTYRQMEMGKIPCAQLLLRESQSLAHKQKIRERKKEEGKEGGRTIQHPLISQHTFLLSLFVK